MDIKWPHSIEAERFVLAAIMLDKNAIAKVLGTLGGEEFYHEHHRLIFQHMLKLFKKETVIDVVTLSDELKKSNNLDRIGGVDELLTLIESIPTAANVTSHAKTVKEKALLRKLVVNSHKLLTGAQEGEGISALLAGACSDIMNLTAEVNGTIQGDDVYLPEETAFKALEMIERNIANPDKPRGVPTGFRKLDYFSKGLREFTVVAAQTGVGKTILGLNWAINIGILNGIPCLYINLEMDAESLIYRIVSNLSSIEEDLLTLGKCEKELKRLHKAIENIHKSKLLITGNVPRNINAIISLIYEYKIKYDIKVVFIDHLREVSPDGMPQDSQKRYLTIGDYCKSIKDICAKLGVRPVVIQQLNRDDTIADSKFIEERASLFCTLNRPDVNGNPYILKVHKNRGGMAPVEIELDFKGETLSMKERVSSSNMVY